MNVPKRPDVVSKGNSVPQVNKPRKQLPSHVRKIKSPKK